MPLRNTAIAQDASNDDGGASYLLRTPGLAYHVGDWASCGCLFSGDLVVKVWQLRSWAIVWLGLTLWCSAVAAADLEMPEAALKAYVDKKDDSFRWEKRRTGSVLSASFAELRMTSQTWRDIAWKHQLFVIKPSSAPADAKHALLFIAGGSWKPELDRPDFESNLPREAQLLALAAEQVQTPVAILLHVPQQPIFDGKTEDAIISYTFEEFMKSRDPEWPLLLPMVKSAVRAMDAVQQFSKDEWSMGIEKFTISGGSKRGWTTWLTGAVDPRAGAIAPMVIDVLNMGPQMKHQRATWGEPSVMIADYTRRGLDQVFDTPNGRTLLKIIDPFSYRQSLTQPKLIVLGTNDPYWPLDAANLYWDGLPGQKHLLYVPNNGHGLRDTARLVGGLAALHRQLVTGQTLPKIDWAFAEQDGQLELRVKSETPPKGVSAWTASTATRDFRESKWTSAPAEKVGDAYICRLPVPPQGCSALFGELTFEGANDVPYYLSTAVRIVGNGQPAKKDKP
ncbi:MAG: PhoPQ-activated protein PqaA family protein [Pirellulales bacterium]